MALSDIAKGVYRTARGDFTTRHRAGPSKKKMGAETVGEGGGDQTLFNLGAVDQALGGIPQGGSGKSIGKESSLKSGLFGTSGGVNQYPIYDQEQLNAIQSLLQQGMQNSNFSGIESLARKNYSEGTVPMLSERFTSMGGHGGANRNSSNFQSTLGRSGTDLEAQLAALRGDYGMKQLDYGLRSPFENAYQGGTQGLLSKLAPLLPLLGGAFAGPMGGAISGVAGNVLSGLR